MGNLEKNASNRPDFVTDEHIRIMDGMAQGGTIAMMAIFSHRPTMKMVFGMNNEQADALWNYWTELRGVEVPR